MTSDNPYRDLPRVDDLAQEFAGALPEPMLLDVIRSALEEARQKIAGGNTTDVSGEIARTVHQVGRRAGVHVINATGVLLHTNLGRARWSDKAVTAAVGAASKTTNLELDIETGGRRRRGEYVTSLLRALTGAEDALIVNNNASALVLALAATASGKTVPVARGELIEIGGSYRLPDVLEVSGCTLVEVGTTNRSRIGDFETAAQVNRIGALLKIHPSNYRVEGFTEQATLRDMADLAMRHEVPLIYDIGSGLLDGDTPWLEGVTPDWARNEPAARQALDEGVDLVTFSGDKLLGGPQAGIIVGKAGAVDTLREHALTRALRVDGVTLAALAETLAAFANNDVKTIPFWRHATFDSDTIETRATSIAESTGGVVVAGGSAIGAGSVPGMTIPTSLVVLEGRDDMFECLLAADAPILARRDNGNLVLDVRTVDPEDDQKLADTIAKCR